MDLDRRGRHHERRSAAGAGRRGAGGGDLRGGGGAGLRRRQGAASPDAGAAGGEEDSGVEQEQLRAGEAGDQDRPLDFGGQRRARGDLHGQRSAGVARARQPGTERGSGDGAGARRSGAGQRRGAAVFQLQLPPEFLLPGPDRAAPCSTPPAHAT